MKDKSFDTSWRLCLVEEVGGGIKVALPDIDLLLDNNKRREKGKLHLKLIFLPFLVFSIDTRRQTPLLSPLKLYISLLLLLEHSFSFRSHLNGPCCYFYLASPLARLFLHPLWSIGTAFRPLVSNNIFSFAPMRGMIFLTLLAFCRL